MSPRIQGFDLVIFDCDGVVADSEVLSCRSLAETLTSFGLPTQIDEVFEHFLGRSFAAVEAHYRAALGEALPDRFRSELRLRLESAYRAGLQPMPHVVDVLEGLDRPFCLASSSDVERIRLTLAVTRLSDYFDGRIFNTAMVKHGKPAPDLFLCAADGMGADPARSLVVEDSVTGVRAGKAAGMTVWGFIGGSHYNGREAETRLTGEGADRVFSSMADFL